MYDLVIVGGGPAGLTAGLYATRGGLKNVLLFEKATLGGQITKSSEVENYPGVLNMVSGLELMQHWPEQSSRFGLQIKNMEVKKVTQSTSGTFLLLLEDNSTIESISVIIATGGKPRKAKFKGEDEFFGRGVGTCATCDGFFYKNKEVAILGGGNTALEEAIFLSNIANRVYVIHRKDEFKAAPPTIKRAIENEKIEFIFNTAVEEVYGDNSGVRGLKLKDLKTGEIKDFPIPGIFVFVGYIINNSILFDENNKPLCAINDGGEIIVDMSMNSSVDGLFAAGDVRVYAEKQVVCAASDGAIAANRAIEYVEHFKGK